MIIELLDGLSARVLSADRVLVRAADGTPLALVLDLGHAIICTHAGENGGRDLSDALRALGVEGTVITNSFTPLSLDAVSR